MTPAECERLILLIEECAEVQQAACKALRHGMENSHPSNEDRTNRELIQDELGDLQAIVNLMIARGDIDYEAVGIAEENKKVRSERYLNHNTFMDL